MSDTADRVKKIVVEHLGVEEDKVTPDASFIDDLGADSLDIVELVMAFEEEFDIEIPDDAAGRGRAGGGAGGGGDGGARGGDGALGAADQGRRPRPAR